MLTMLSLEVFTDHTTDAILSHRPFGNNHQVGVNASLPQVVAALAAVPRLHVKLAVKTLHGGLRDVNTAVDADQEMTGQS